MVRGHPITSSTSILGCDELTQITDIGGLEDVIEEIKESVIYPLTMPDLYLHAGPLLAAPSGVLVSERLLFPILLEPPFPQQGSKPISLN